MSHTILILLLLFFTSTSQPNIPNTKISQHLYTDFQKGKADFLILIKEPLNLKTTRDIKGTLIPEITDFSYKGRVIVAEVNFGVTFTVSIAHPTCTRFTIRNFKNAS
jgi:hypothetical protein